MVTFAGGHLNESSTRNCSSEEVPREKYQVIQLPRGVELFQEAKETPQFIGEHIRTIFKNGIWRLPLVGLFYTWKILETRTHKRSWWQKPLINKWKLKKSQILKLLLWRAIHWQKLSAEFLFDKDHPWEHKMALNSGNSRFVVFSDIIACVSIFLNV